MSVLGEIRTSLDAMGFEQQAFLFAFLTSYPLSLGGLLESRAQRWAGAVAAAALLGFVLATDPWIHGVLVVVFMVVALGLFIALAWMLDGLARAATRTRRVPAPAPAGLPPAVADAGRDRESKPPCALPLTGTAGTT